METMPKTQRQIAWKHHLTMSFVIACDVLIVNSFHYFQSGFPFDWTAPALVFGTGFACLTICDWGQAWKISPPYLILGALLSVGLWRSATSSIELWRQFGSIEIAMYEFLGSVGLAFLTVSLLIAYRRFAKICLEFQR